MSKYYLALDVGGTNVIAGLVEADGRVVTRRRFPTRSDRGPEAVINDIEANLKALVAEVQPASRPQAMAMGMPGWLLPEEGVLIQAPNMPGWVNVPIAQILSDKLNIPVRLENDSNLYALGEWRLGAAKGLKNLLVVTLGTGVGGGLILENKLWTGSFASSVEIGHTPVGLAGAKCGCGRRGCLETIASGPGLSRLARQWLKKAHPSQYKGRPEDINPRVMFELAQAGDEMSLTLFKKAGKALGLVLVSIFNLLGLEGAVIGGGVAGAFDFIEPGIKDILRSRIIVAKPEQVAILKGELGEDAPLVGAAALLRDLNY